MKRIYYISECCNDTAAYVFESFDAALEWARAATTWDDDKIKREIKICERDQNNGFIVFCK